MVTPTRTPLPTRPGQSVRLSELSVDDLYARSWGDDLASLLGDRIGRPGMPWRGGRSMLEQHPELRLRGGQGRPSKYWDVYNDAAVRGMLRKAAWSIAHAPFRVVPGELPAWLEGNAQAEAARDLQHAYIQRLFWRWQQQGRRGWLRFVRNVLYTVPVEGFAWFEIVADTRTLTVDGLGTHTVLWPDSPPEWRAPWAIRYWIHEDEQPIGVVANFSQSTDWDGGTGDSWTVIPIEKVLRVASEEIGSNLYGESWLRPIYEDIKAKRALRLVEMVGKTVNGVGELFFKIPPGVTVSEETQRKLDAYLSGRSSAAAPGAVLPDGIEVERLDGDPIDHSPLADRIDRQIALALNQDDRLIALQQVGAMSARETASNDAQTAFDSITSEMVAEPFEDFACRMISHSWPELVRDGWIFTPKLVWHDDQKKDVTTHVTNLRGAADSGLIQWTPEDEAALREDLNITPREIADEADETTKTISPDDLQSLRLAYTSGILHDPDFGNAIRRQYGIEDVTPESLAAFNLLTGADDTPLPNEDAAE